MSKFTIAALFCEDVRVEQTGQETLVGVLPDNVNVATIPSLMPKFAIYVRCNFAEGFVLRNLRIKMNSPSGNVLLDNFVEQSLIKQTIKESSDNQSPIYSIKTFAVFAPFNITEAGHYKVIGIVNDGEHLAGAIRLGITP